MLLALFVLGGICCVRTSAQPFALKTNVLYDATATINLGAEMRVAPKWSVDISGNFNAWNLGGARHWKHWLVQPEGRFWLCEASSGHFFALHALGGKYNIGHIGFARDILGWNLRELRDHRYQGWFVGAGVGYGYSWLLNQHWSIEGEVAVGWIRSAYDVFECEGCGKRTDYRRKDTFAPTKLAINLVYVF
ncbi:MAG: DUF3575 domain-containing protein [Muribaculaceae bacterium]|nr:DUF3575 domain-containing protein [Muribaculaceae bacterium]